MAGRVKTTNAANDITIALVDVVMAMTEHRLALGELNFQKIDNCWAVSSAENIVKRHRPRREYQWRYLHAVLTYCLTYTH